MNLEYDINKKHEHGIFHYYGLNTLADTLTDRLKEVEAEIKLYDEGL